MSEWYGVRPPPVREPAPPPPDPREVTESEGEAASDDAAADE
ncbi:MAG TPA: hypothetical protein VG497_20420 [Kribbella sp.]|nr:hypothetical protein [Kribbella sp.]